jgi:hypothetical protein
LCVPLLFAVLVADLCPNRCDHLGAHDALVLGAQSANCLFHRGATSHLHRVGAMSPTSLDDFSRWSGLSQLKFVLRAMVEQQVAVQTQARRDELTLSDLPAGGSCLHLELAKSYLRSP